MDKDTRNAIERATQRARRLLEDDFVSQLEGTFDVLRSGEVAATGGPHLTPRQRVVREKIVAAVEHKRAAGAKPGEAVASYARDAAFTALNRFVALKMLEARGLLQECVTKGELSSGYKEFGGLAPGVALLADGVGYRLYIECLFDELSTEVKVLFDRRDPTAALWPRRQTFEELLAALNAPELAAIWDEDETIGWVYQFFNSGDERSTMREESAAPRNSRELAVRNQFFTPRYVVQFLAENTLARTWVEMMGEGGTSIADSCDSLLRGVESPGPRPKKDPRDIKVLDPACGSGHFLIYAFDLFLTIYEEAWNDPGAAPLGETGRTLRQEFPDLSSLRRAAPSLVLGRNLYGVDIDPHCAPVAALALWLRAQRAYRDFEVPASERPRITRTHIVVAEPMPGDLGLVEAFASELQPPLLAGLFRKMVAEMRLAGELGTLIRIDKGIAGELHRARDEWSRQREAGDYLPGFASFRIQKALDVSQIDVEGFFEQTEAMLLAALHRFAESATGGTGVRRALFVDDAVQGVALIDLLRTQFDIVVMNPPFGQTTPRAAAVLRAQGSDGWKDIYAGFFEAMLRLTDPVGYVGAISSSQFFHTRQLRGLRENWVAKRRPRILVDLGPDVLDGATVQTALSVLGPPTPGGNLTYLDLFSVEDKATALRRAVSEADFKTLSLSDLASVPGSPFCLHSAPGVLRQWHVDQTLEPHTAVVATGNHTFDDERFLRL